MSLPVKFGGTPYELLQANLEQWKQELAKETINCFEESAASFKLNQLGERVRVASALVEAFEDNGWNRDGDARAGSQKKRSK